MLILDAAAMDFRSQVCGGEKVIQDHNMSLARKAGDVIAEMFGTEVMDNKTGSLRQCAFSNVRLPIEIGNGAGQVKPENADLVATWMKWAADPMHTFQIFLYRGHWYWRISGQIYVEMADFVKGANIAAGLCERVRKGEYLSKGN